MNTFVLNSDSTPSPPLPISVSVYSIFVSQKKNDDEEANDEEILTFTSLSHVEPRPYELEPRKKAPSAAVAKLRSALTVFFKARSNQAGAGLGTRVIGTLFGHRRGHVHFTIQENPNLDPAFQVELPIRTTVLVREMASGLARIALECEKIGEKKKRLLEEPVWRTYCNGKKCGYGSRRECGPEEWKVLAAVGPVTMGAGVLPSGSGGSDEDIMYMRGKFERVVGSKDSEAFYMMNPDGHGGPELSIYLLRV
ncbi:hypothetical protein NMG60_11009469 [Bertholletia excelsa]